MQGEAAVTLDVRFIDEPALWSWEIRDATSRQLLRGGWPDEWMGYRTREAACAAGLAALDGMLGGGDDGSRIDRLEACQLEHTDRAVLGSAG